MKWFEKKKVPGDKTLPWMEVLHTGFFAEKEPGLDVSRELDELALWSRASEFPAFAPITFEPLFFQNIEQTPSSDKPISRSAPEQPTGTPMNEAYDSPPTRNLWGSDILENTNQRAEREPEYHYLPPQRTNVSFGYTYPLSAESLQNSWPKIPPEAPTPSLDPLSVFDEIDPTIYEEVVSPVSIAPAEPVARSEPAPHAVSEQASGVPAIRFDPQVQIPFALLKKSAVLPVLETNREAEDVIARLEEVLLQFGIEGRVVGIQRGPIITRYELKIPPGIKVSRIQGLTDEIAMALEALRIRIEAPIPGRSTVGVEVPNKKRARVMLGDIVSDPAYTESEKELPLPLGRDIAGNIVIEDLSKMPHLLIAGATGSGKSVSVNSFITSLILNRSPDEVRFILVDPKLVELSHYNDIPHLLHPVITDHNKAILALNWAVEEMERRYEDLAEMRSRDIRTYNDKIKSLKSHNHRRMPYIVVLIDELGDLMMVAGKDVESSIIRLSQKARAVGIHLILATQRPSVDVITALIKANCPARIALQVAQKTDSRTILDSNGAEDLLGQGDLLFKHPSRGQLIRIQAPLVSDSEVEEVVSQVKKSGKPVYIELDDPRMRETVGEEVDEELLEEAWKIILEDQKASASYLQRRLRIGYNRAARMIETFEARGYIGPQIGSKPREILRSHS